MTGAAAPVTQAEIERRRVLGIDRFDEVWEGDYRVVNAPHPFHGYVDDQLAALLYPRALAAGLVPLTAFNVGEPGNFRVPERGYLRSLPDTAFVSSAAAVVEVRSPGDDTYRKFDFYAAHGVQEILVVLPLGHAVEVYELDGATYRRAAGSRLLDIAAADIAAAITWP